MAERLPDTVAIADYLVAKDHILGVPQMIAQAPCRSPKHLWRGQAVWQDLRAGRGHGVEPAGIGKADIDAVFQQG